MPKISLLKYAGWLGGLGVFEALSYATYFSSQWQPFVLAGVGLAALIIGLWRPAWLAYLTIAELSVGGKGYLLFARWHEQAISLRIVLFAVLAISASIVLLRRRQNLPSVQRPWAWLTLTAWVGLAAVIGRVHGASSSAVWLDGNAFLFLLAWWGWWVTLRTDQDWRAIGLTILLAGATLVGLKSVIVFALFAHPPGNIHDLYAWIRNTGIGEVTHIQGNLYRVFFQSQVSTVFVFLLAWGAWLWSQAPRWWLMPLIFSAAGIYLSLSRSFWLGFASAIILLFIWSIINLGSVIWRRWLWLIPISAGVWLLTSWAVNFPSPIQWGGQSHGRNPVVARLTGQGATQAADARRAQAGPLWVAIKRQPVLGSGFGTTVTYDSTDPRVRGSRTTAAFELGYLDLWLKLGLIGVLLYAAWAWQILRRLAGTVWAPWFLPSLVALAVIHATTPYLNHPLGLSWILLSAMFAYDPGA